MDSYSKQSFGALNVGMQGRVGIVVVDFQLAFTSKKFPLGGAPMTDKAVKATSRLLKVARKHDIPIASCFTAYNSVRDMPHWKIAAVREQFLIDHPGSRLDPRIYDPAYDVVVMKSAPSIFFQTRVVPFLVKAGVETVVVTGCNTSGCIRASVIDSFSWGFRTIVPEDCVGDVEEGPHKDNLRDISRRYADVTDSDSVIAYIKGQAAGKS